MTGMPLHVVTDHSLAQLKMIYEFIQREQARSKLMDLGNMATAFGGDKKSFSKHVETLTSIEQGGKNEIKTSSVSAHLDRIRMMGVPSA